MRRTYRLSGARQSSSSANARAASSADGATRSPPKEVARRRSRSRSRAVNSAARPRFSANADALRPASMPMRSSRPRASTVAVSVTRTLAMWPRPSSTPISPTVSPGPALQSSAVSSPLTRTEADTAPSTMSSISRARSPWRQSTSPARTVRRRSTRASSTSSASPRPANSGRPARKSTVSRSDIQVVRLEPEPLRGQLGGEQRVLRHLEPRREVAGEGLGGDDHRARRIAARHLPAAVALGVLAADRVPEAHERQVRLEHLVVGRIPPVVERDAGGDQGAAGAETEVDRRRGVDAVRGADGAQDAQGGGGGLGEIAGLRRAVGIVELRQDEGVDPL